MPRGDKPPAAARSAATRATERIPQHSLVAITWEDAAFELDKDPGTLQMVTVGYLIRQTQAITVVAGEASPALDYFRAYTAIPASIIRSIRVLQPV